MKAADSQGPASPTSGRQVTPPSIPVDTEFATRLANEAAPPMVRFRPYQQGVFMDRVSGILILHWSRQIGKSFTLASWAVDRLLTRPGRLVTVLSNSRDNGAEFVAKCAEVCNLMGLAKAKADEFQAQGDANVFVEEDMSPDLQYENMRMEVRITVRDSDGRLRTGRIKVLAANPRTARGFSGDLILDEFAFHEDSQAIWEAAEPILSSNPDFLCRIASTGNGKHNMFYRMASGPGPYDGTVFQSTSGFSVTRVSRSEAYKQGVKIYDPKTRNPITPFEAEAGALDKRAYRQNYECQFADENMCLLTQGLISAAERSLITIDSQEWTAASLARMYRAEGFLEVGADFGRTRDRSSVPVIERLGQLRRVIAWLRMEGMRTPEQRRQIEMVCQMPKFLRLEGDSTGIGLGVMEELQEKFGESAIGLVNFSTTEPVSDRLIAQGTKRPTARVTELMATDLLAEFESKSVEIPADEALRDSLRKPEKVVSPGGRVSIAAERDPGDHADDFWGLALAVRAGNRGTNPFAPIPWSGGQEGVAAQERRERGVS
ncbi:MAG: terminase family protein [Verrucomicrobiota bacterium]